MPKEYCKPITEGLNTASTQFREFAVECMELARTSSSLDQRMVYLKMASAWHQTAQRWEKDFHRWGIGVAQGSTDYAQAGSG